MLSELRASELVQRQGNDTQGRVLFENISFCWKAPGLHVLMGASGAGKSTLLKTLGGVWEPSEGKVQIDGAPLWSSNGNQNAKILERMGFAFQNNALFSSMRVVDNISFPHRKRFPSFGESARTALAHDWLKKVGLEASAHAFPHELSGGMQKRLSIARTLCLSPDFIFLDDPTAGLDPITSRIMAALVNDLLKGSSALVIIVTNDPDRAQDWGPNIHFLEDGKLASPGEASYSEIFEKFQ